MEVVATFNRNGLIDGNSYQYWWYEGLCFLGGRESVYWGLKNSNAKTEANEKRGNLDYNLQAYKSW